MKDYGETQCKICGKTFTKTHWSQTICSDECRKENIRRRNAADLKKYREQHPDRLKEYEERRKIKRRVVPTEKTCPVCGTVFKANGKYTYCSAECRKKHKLERERERYYELKAAGYFPKSFWKVDPAPASVDEWEEDIEDEVMIKACGIPCTQCTLDWCPYD